MNTRKIYYLFIILTLLLAFTGCEEDDPTDNILTFEKSITIGTSSQMTDIIINDDNSYLTVGTAELNGTSALILMKVSPAGDTLWTKKFQNQEGYSIIKTQDGNYAISGVSKIKSSDTYSRTIVTKVDPQGNYIWSTELPTSTELSPRSEFFSKNTNNIVEGTDRSLWVITNPNGHAQQHFTLDVIGLNGVKKQSIELPGMNAADIKATKDGAFIIAGTSEGHWIFLTKINSNANIVWSKIIRWDGFQSASSVVQTADGGFALTGFSGNNKSFPRIILLQTNQNGDFNYETGSHGFKMAYTSSGNMIDIKKNNNFLIAGYGYSYDSFTYDINYDEPELIALSVSASGDLQHSKNFGKVGHFFFIQETMDNGIILGGNKNGHIFLTKTKPNFEL